MTTVKTCNKPGCTEEVFPGAQRFACIKHHRLSRMRWQATRRGLYCPSFSELEGMLPLDMKCPHCREAMEWSGEKAARNSITLQHDRSGGIRFLCFSCNSKHQKVPGDKFYEIGPDEKHCPACKQVLPIDQFYRKKTVKRASFTPFLPRCKKCTAELWAEKSEATNAKRRVGAVACSSKCSRCGSRDGNSWCPQCRDDIPPERDTPDDDGASLL